MTEKQSALEILKAWRRRDDNDNGFSKNIERDAQQTLHAIYDEVIAALSLSPNEASKITPAMQGAGVGVALRWIGQAENLSDLHDDADPMVIEIFQAMSDAESEPEND